jgi:hypothetical protein
MLRPASNFGIVQQPRQALTMLPAAEHAIVDAAKVRDYLLSHEHPVGRFKAAFFESLGYTLSDWMRLQRDLIELSVSERHRRTLEPVRPQVRSPWYPSGTFRTPC